MKTSAQFQGERALFNASTTGFSLIAGQRRQEGRTNQLFYTHCKRNGHTMEKCYKIHGYLGSNKQGGRPRTFRNANNGWTDAKKTKEPATIPSLPGLSQDQSRQLFQFLSNLTVGGGSKQEEEEASASAAYMAGISQVLKSIHYLCSLAHDALILDSGASEHICSEQTILHDLCHLQQPILVNLYKWFTS